MKRIITAIDNPKINIELKKEKNFEIIGKDIQYREAILEILEKRKDINIIIIYEKIPGKINIEELIKKIKKLKTNVKIIFFLEKENYRKKEFLKKMEVKNIYTKNMLNSENIQKIINNENIANKKYNKKIKNKSAKIITIIKNKNKIINLKIFLEKYIKNKNLLIINFNKKTGKNKINKFDENKKEIKKYIEDIKQKDNKNIDIILNMNQEIRNIKNNYNKKECEILEIILEENMKKYDYIIIINSYIESKEVEKIILKKSDRYILEIKEEYLGIEGFREITNLYNNYIRNSRKSLHIIVKNKLKSISEYIIKEEFKKVNYIFFDTSQKVYNKKYIKKIEEIKIKMKIKNFLKK